MPPTASLPPRSRPPSSLPRGPGPPRGPAASLQRPGPGSVGLCLAQWAARLRGGAAPGSGRRAGQAPNLYWGELLAVGARVDLGVGRRAAQSPDPGGDPRGGVGVGKGDWRRPERGAPHPGGWREGSGGWEVGNPDQLRGPPRGGTGARQTSEAQAQLLEVEDAVCQAPGNGSSGVSGSWIPAIQENQQTWPGGVRRERETSHLYTY